MSLLHGNLVAFVITGGLLFVGGCVSTEQQPVPAGNEFQVPMVTSTPVLPAPVTPVPDIAGNSSQSDREQLAAFVGRAVDYVKINGRNAALAEFNNQEGQFIMGDLYIFAYDYNGTVIALPFQKELLGLNRIENTDPDGVHYVREIGQMAQKGGGYTEYRYPDPSRNFSVERKVSYALDVDGTWYVGSGYYIVSGTGE